jgi:hypothetical protein
MLPPEGPLFSVDGVESLDGGVVQHTFVRVQGMEFFKQIKRINQDRGVRFPMGEGSDPARPLPTPRTGSERASVTRARNKLCCSQAFSKQKQWLRGIFVATEARMGSWSETKWVPDEREMSGKTAS